MSLRKPAFIVFVSVMTTSVFSVNASASNIAILNTYADLALDGFSQALSDATNLQDKVAAFAKNPTIKSLNTAKTAWLQSRESYGQTEIFRLANGPIDAEDGWVAAAYGAPEGQLNAWPLDENMIDYTIDEDGKKTSGNIIDSTGYFKPGGEDAKKVNVTTITAAAISALNENGGEANVASGYHAIEFLLWGQDQDYNDFSEDKITHGAMTAGQRPLTDFTKDKFAKRRLAYLVAVSEKLASDLYPVVQAWKKTLSNNCTKEATGCYRAAFLGQLKGKDAKLNLDAESSIRKIITGMGVFIKS